MTFPMKKLQIAGGHEAIVDIQDYSILAQRRWFLRNGYAACTENRRNFYLHHFVLPLIPGYQVDHINRNRLDNRRENLRLVTSQQNKFNRGPRKQKKFKGIYFDKKLGLWKAEIKNGIEKEYLGSFLFPESAAAAYDKRAKSLHGIYAKLNEVEPHPNEPKFRFRTTPNKVGTSGYVGVSFSKRTERPWEAYVGVNNHKKHIGFFHTPKEAFAARVQFIVDLNKNPALGVKSNLRKSNKSGVKGVFWSPRFQRWKAKFNGKYLGSFYTKDDAMHARQKAESEFS